MPPAKAQGSAAVAHYLWLLSASVSGCAGRSHVASPVSPEARREVGDASATKADVTTAADSTASAARPWSDSVGRLAGEDTSTSARVEKAAAAARELARSSGHDAALAAGDVLLAIADALEALPDAGRRAREQIAEVRFQGKRLRRSDSLSFGLVKWIEAGLTDALEALERIGPPGDRSAYWLSAARSAVKSIDPRSSLTFQRGPVQDAVRTTIDALIVIAQGPCPSTQSRSSGSDQK